MIKYNPEDVPDFAFMNPAKTSVMTDVLLNFFLMLRYRFFRRFCRKTSFGQPFFTENFDEPGFIVSDRDLYWENMVTLKENVEVRNGKLRLHVRYENREFSNWWGTQNKTWSIGYVNYRNRAFSYGVWSVRCKLPSDTDSWPAIWLLRERHAEPETKIKLGRTVKAGENQLFLPEWTIQKAELNWFVWLDSEPIGFVTAADRAIQLLTLDKAVPETGENPVYVSPDHIIPEVDIMEILHGKIQQTVHFGYSAETYKTHEWNVKRGKPVRNKEIEFAVELHPNGYRFYIDRILTAVLTRRKARSEAPAYLILNNAKQNGLESGENSVFEILDVRFYRK